MTEVLKKISVDLSRRGNTRLIFARQNDQGSRRVSIKLTDGGAPYIVPKGTVATVNILRSDGTSAAFSAELTEDGNVELSLGLWALSVVGEARCSVSLYGSGNKKLTSADFVLDVQEALYSGEGISNDESYTLLTSLVSEISEIKKVEEARVLAEADRAEAESLRREAEAERNEADDVRAINDSQFAHNESLRMLAETERADAEASREAAEAVRVAEEEKRAAANEERMKEIESLKRASGIALDDEAEQFVSEDVEGALGELGERLSVAEKTLSESVVGKSGKVIIKANSWAGALKHSIYIKDLGENDMVSFSPISISDRDTIAACGFFISPEASNMVVSVSVDKIPQVDINLYFFISRGAAV